MYRSHLEYRWEFQLRQGFFFLTLTVCLRTMPKHTDNVPAVDQETIYTLDSMTCRILPGLQAREYTVNSLSNPISILDICVWAIALYLTKVIVPFSCCLDPFIHYICLHSLSYTNMSLQYYSYGSFSSASLSAKVVAVCVCVYFMPDQMC